jgi:hypothetical protein
MYSQCVKNITFIIKVISRMKVKKNPVPNAAIQHNMMELQM